MKVRDSGMPERDYWESLFDLHFDWLALFVAAVIDRIDQSFLQGGVEDRRKRTFARWCVRLGERPRQSRVIDGSSVIRKVNRMAKIARKTVTRRAASAAARFSANYKTRSRTRIAKLVKAGRGEESFNDVARLLGIDLARGERARLVTVCGHKVG